MDYTDEQKAAIIAEYDRRRANNERAKDIEADFKKRGISRTFQNWRTHTKKTMPTPTKETPMSIDEAPVKVLEGQGVLLESDTLAEVHYGAVHEFDRLPDGYAKVIQPMRPYSDAEEWALNKSMELYGFLGAIILDQYGRILDGNQRQRIARLRGLSVPSTTTRVEDDAHALKIATALNTVKRYYPREQRLELAALMREQGFSYREIAVALDVSKDTVQRDIFGAFKVIPAPETEVESVSSETIPANDHGKSVSSETISEVAHEIDRETVSSETILTREPSTPPQTAGPVKRVQRKGGGTYPAQRSPEAQRAIAKGQAEATRERLSERGQPNHSWINVLSQAHRLCSSLKRMPDLDDVLKSWGSEGRQKAVEYLRPLHQDTEELLSALTLWGLPRMDMSEEPTETA